MNCLIILADQGAESVGAQVARAAEAELRALGAAVRLHDLYAMRFQPAILASDFAAWGNGEQPSELLPLQADLRWAELLLLIYPIRLGGTPAMLKGYIDRVLAQSFAYGLREGRMAGFLTEKRALLCPLGEAPALSESMQRVMGGATLAFCGIAVEETAPEGLGERIRELMSDGGA